MKRTLLLTAAAVVVLALLVGAFAVGRTTAPRHDRGWVDAENIGYESGVSVGRALQVGAQLAPGERDLASSAFQAGYRAAQADAYGSYDGGWALDRPYIVIIGKGTNGAPYRIANRDEILPGVSYRLCADQVSVCH